MKPRLIKEPLAIVDMIGSAAAELKKSNLVAAMEVYRVFNILADYENSQAYTSGMMWVSVPSKQGTVNSRYIVTAKLVADYFNNCMFQDFIVCLKADGTFENINPELVMYSPPILMENFQMAGYTWVPRRGVYHIDEIPKNEVTATSESASIFPYRTLELDAMHSAALKFWVDYDTARPPSRSQYLHTSLID